ncbi:MAG: hypothetical protein RR338_03005 [Clostridia bacterium]
MTNNEILELEVRSEDIGVVTIKQYFKQLLLTLFAEGECFSGKRPFGNSAWEYDIMDCLIKNKVFKTEIDEYGEEDYDDMEFNRIICELITSM